MLREKMLVNITLTDVQIYAEWNSSERSISRPKPYGDIHIDRSRNDAT